MILQDKLREFLEKSGMTREEFSKNADIPLSTLNTLLAKEDPNPSYMTTMKIARTARISLDEIGGIISDDMGNEEIERIKKAYAKNEEAIKKTLDEYAAKMADLEKTEAHDKEVIRRQDLRMKEQLERIAYQMKAIRWLRIALGSSIILIFFLVYYIIILLGIV